MFQQTIMATYRLYDCGKINLFHLESSANLKVDREFRICDVIIFVNLYLLSHHRKSYKKFWRYELFLRAIRITRASLRLLKEKMK